jgi:hypothetical protein
VTAWSLRVCRDARAPHWQLGPLPPDRGRLTLVMWTSDVPPADGGVAPEVARVLARTWTSIARVTFLSSSARGSKLLSTIDPGVAMQLFEDAAFPWWLQGQLVLLSDPAADSSTIDERSVLALIDDDWARRAAPLAAHGVEGVVRPGVDGDLAGVLALNDRLDSRMLASLEREAQQAGMSLSVVPETALLERPPVDVEGRRRR